MTDLAQRRSSDSSVGAPPALELRRLSGGYGRTTVVRDISITVPSGQVVAVVGPNGAGKTTLLRLISGFLRPSQGTVHLFGEDITATQPFRRFESGLCHVPEGRGIFRSLTVRENLAMQARRRHDDMAISKACEAFPVLGNRISQIAGTLSGGEQQMLALASAYVRDPKLILVDEASLGLAPLIVDRIFDFMADLAARGSALLIVDQFAARALALAHHAYVLSQGSVVFSGPAHDLDASDLRHHYLGAGDKPG